MRGIAVAARAGVHADTLPLLGREKRASARLFRSMKLCEKFARRVDLDRQPALGEVDLDLVRALSQATAHLGFVLAQQVVDELLARYNPGSPRADTSGSRAEGEITACFTGTWA